MTKEAYFEMCEALGTAPLEHEIPMELGDFPLEVQIAYTIFNHLRDVKDDFSGSYRGKDYSRLDFFFDLYDVDKRDWLLYLTLFTVMDKHREELYAKKLKENSSKKPA